MVVLYKLQYVLMIHGVICGQKDRTGLYCYHINFPFHFASTHDPSSLTNCTAPAFICWCIYKQLNRSNKNFINLVICQFGYICIFFTVRQNGEGILTVLLFPNLTEWESECSHSIRVVFYCMCKFI